MIPDGILDRIKPDANGCWLWTGSCSSDGYGRAKVAGKIVNVHRLLYEEMIGTPDAGMVLHHTCYVPRCVNPLHLEVMTHREHRKRHTDSTNPPPRLPTGKGADLQRHTTYPRNPQVL